MAKKRDHRSEFLKRCKIPKNERERLLQLLHATERAITNENTSVNEFFKEQASKLTKELEELGKK
jgi:hypothetical protein